METGGPAFPMHYEVTEKSEMVVSYDGMTLRDYFAGHSGIGVDELLAIYKAIDMPEPMSIKGICEDLSKVHGIYADARLKERNK